MGVSLETSRDRDVGRWPATRRARARRRGALAAAVGCGLLGLFALASQPAGASPRHRAPSRSHLTGTLTGFPNSSPQTPVYVEAVSLRNATVAASAVATGDRYSMSVPRGPYIVLARASDLQSGRTITRTSHAVLLGSSTRTVSFAARAAGAHVRAHAAASSGGAIIGIGRIPISIDIPGATPNGNVEDGFINSLLPSCQADGGKLVDETPEVKEAIKTEQRLSDEGRTAFKIQVNPLTPDLVIEGQVNVDANGKPVADFKIVDPKSGRVVDHIVVAGDPGEVTNLIPFYRQVGKGLGGRLCKKKPKPAKRPRPPRKKKHKPRKPRKPSAPAPTVNTLAYSGTLDGSAQSGTGTTVSVHLDWSEQATSRAKDPSTVTWQLTSLTGTFSRQSAQPGVSCKADLSVKPGYQNFPSFGPSISFQGTYQLNVHSPGDGLAGSSSPATYQIQSSDPNTDELCGDPPQMLRSVENPPAATSSSAAMQGALAPIATVHGGFSDTSFNFSFSQPDSLGGVDKLNIVSSISFHGTK